MENFSPSHQKIQDAFGTVRKEKNEKLREIFKMYGKHIIYFSDSAISLIFSLNKICRSSQFTSKRKPLLMLPKKKVKTPQHGSQTKRKRKERAEMLKISSLKPKSVALPTILPVKLLSNSLRVDRFKNPRQIRSAKPRVEVRLWAVHFSNGRISTNPRN